MIRVCKRGRNVVDEEGEKPRSQDGSLWNITGQGLLVRSREVEINHDLGSSCKLRGNPSQRGKPNGFQLFTRPRWEILSNALLKSKRIKIVTLRSSILLLTSSESLRRAVCILKLERKPESLGSRMLSAMNLLICLWTILSRILENSGRLSIGLVSDGDSGVRIFNRRRLIAIFQGDGNTYIRMESLKISVTRKRERQRHSQLRIGWVYAVQWTAYREQPLYGKYAQRHAYVESCKQYTLENNVYTAISYAWDSCGIDRWLAQLTTVEGYVARSFHLWILAIIIYR